MSYFEILSKGGIVMVILGIISFIAFGLIVERIIKLFKIKKEGSEFWKELYNYLENKDFGSATHLCDIKTGVASNILSKALRASEVDISLVSESMEGAAKKEIFKMEKNLSALSTIAATAPLIGFLGTVAGMVKVFIKISQTGGGVDISLLANGIWEALITTIGGLTVGIISIIAYNFLVSKIENITSETEEVCNDFLLKLKGVKNEDKS